MRFRGIEDANPRAVPTYILKLLLTIHVAELGRWGTRGQGCGVCKSGQPRQSSSEGYGSHGLPPRHLSLHLLSSSVDGASYNRRLSRSRHRRHCWTCPDSRSCAKSMRYHHVRDDHIALIFTASLESQNLPNSYPQLQIINLRDTLKSTRKALHAPN